MTLGEYVSRFSKSLRRLRETKTERTVGVINDTFAQVKRRIQTTGVDYEGSQYKGYSKIYKVERAGDGYQVNYFDMTRTGSLWNSINVFVERDGRFNTIAVLKARDKNNDEKLRGNLGIRPNILRPSKTELAFALKVWRERALKELNNVR